MASCSNCCVFNNSLTINLADPCVCNADYGTTLVTSDGKIYIRTKQTIPCSLADWVYVGNSTAIGTFKFDIIDEAAATTTIDGTLPLNVTGVDGVGVTVLPQTIEVSGLTTTGSGNPIGTPVKNSQTNFYVDTDTNTLWLWNTLTLTWEKVIANADILISFCNAVTTALVPTRQSYVFQYDGTTSCYKVLHDHTPYAAIRTNSLIALEAQFLGEATSTLNGDTLTYLWSSNTGTVVFGSNTNNFTTATFPSPGEYIIQLKVTNSRGFAFTTQKKYKVDKILYVNGVDADHSDIFTSIKAAIDWMTLYVVPADYVNYLIEVYGVTTDTAVISANGAKVHLNANAQIPVGVSFSNGTTNYWSGESSNGYPNILIPSGQFISVSNTSTIYFNGFTIKGLGSSYLIDSLGVGGNVTLTNMYLEGTKGIRDSVGNVHVFNNSKMLMNESFYSITNGTLSIDNSQFDMSAGSVGQIFGVMLNNVGGNINNSRFSLTNSTSSALIGFDIVPAPAKPLYFTNNHVDINGISAGTASNYVGGMFIHGLGTLIYINNCSIIANHYGIIFQNVSVGTTIITNSFISGATNAALASSSTYLTINATALANVRVHQCVLRTLTVGPITFVAGTLLTGDNISI